MLFCSFLQESLKCFLFSLFLMKLKILFLLLVFVLVGCTPFPSLPEKKCDLSYSLINGSCCLDKNANQICDREETQRLQTVIREKPVLLVGEECRVSRFTCEQKELTPDYVLLRLRFDRDELLTVKNITLTSLRCSESFDTALNFNEDAVFKIPCVIDSDALKSEVVVDALIQPVVRHSNGQIYDYESETAAVLKGTISGNVG